MTYYNINEILKFMRFKVFMINNQGKLHDETIIASNEYEAKRNVKSFNPNSRILDTKWVYK